MNKQAGHLLTAEFALNVAHLVQNTCSVIKVQESLSSRCITCTLPYIGYARVSTRDQNLALQLDVLHQAGCETIFQEKASGATKVRPEPAGKPTAGYYLLLNTR